MLMRLQNSFGIFKRRQLCSRIWLRQILVAAILIFRVAAINADAPINADELSGGGSLPEKPLLPEKPVLPENVLAKTDMIYGQAGGERLLCDLYLPKHSKTARPAILFIHGGGWAVGNKRQVWPIYLKFAGEGFVVMS